MFLDRFSPRKFMKIFLPLNFWKFKWIEPFFSTVWKFLVKLYWTGATDTFRIRFFLGNYRWDFNHVFLTKCKKFDSYERSFCLANISFRFVIRCFFTPLLPYNWNTNSNEDSSCFVQLKFFQLSLSSNRLSEYPNFGQVIFWILGLRFCDQIAQSLKKIISQRQFLLLGRFFFSSSRA